MSFDLICSEYWIRFGTSQSLWNRAMSFDYLCLHSPVSMRLNPFGTGQCLSTSERPGIFIRLLKSQSLWNRAMSFDYLPDNMKEPIIKSQSLWNRAMSFDLIQTEWLDYRIASQSLWNRAMSFDRNMNSVKINMFRLNPFGTGQCLSTK